jgi:hypothetical protein
MKTKKSDIAVKIFLVVVAVILVGLIIAWSTGVFKDKKKDLSKGTEKINSAISSMSEYDIQMYSEASISGDSLVDLIERVRKEQLDLSIVVKTNQDASGKTYTKEASSVLTPNKEDDEYINPNGFFKGVIDDNENNVITGITFTQH